MLRVLADFGQVAVTRHLRRHHDVHQHQIDLRLVRATASPALRGLTRISNFAPSGSIHVNNGR